MRSVIGETIWILFMIVVLTAITNFPRQTIGLILLFVTVQRPELVDGAWIIIKHKYREAIIDAHHCPECYGKQDYTVQNDGNGSSYSMWYCRKCCKDKTQ